jgi:hypothetical protein
VRSTAYWQAPPELEPAEPLLELDDPPELEELPDPESEEASSPAPGLPALPPHAAGTTIAAAIKEESSER